MSSGFARSELGILLDMHNQPSGKFIGKDPVTWLYPLVEPYNAGRLKVSPLHEIFFEESGNPSGKPVVFLHGGPGGGSEPKQRRFFHPDKYRVVNFDQRGSGKSTPCASLEENTTRDLVGDMGKLREHLGIARWMVFGVRGGPRSLSPIPKPTPTGLPNLCCAEFFYCASKKSPGSTRGVLRRSIPMPGSHIGITSHKENAETCWAPIIGD